MAKKQQETVRMSAVNKVMGMEDSDFIEALEQHKRLEHNENTSYIEDLKEDLETLQINLETLKDISNKGKQLTEDAQGKFLIALESILTKGQYKDLLENESVAIKSKVDLTEDYKKQEYLKTDKGYQEAWRKHETFEKPILTMLIEARQTKDKKALFNEMNYRISFKERRNLLIDYYKVVYAMDDIIEEQQQRKMFLEKKEKKTLSEEYLKLFKKVYSYRRKVTKQGAFLTTYLPFEKYFYTIQKEENDYYIIVYNARKNTLQYNDRESKINAIKREGLTPVRMLSLMNDKTQHVLVETDGILNTEVNGQLSVMFATNLAKASNKNMQVPVYISLLYEGNNNLKTSKRVTMYQNALFSAICTFYNYQKETGAVYFTDQEIWRIMNGKQPNDSKARAKPNQLERINKNLEQLSVIRLTMDITEEIKNGFIYLNDERLTGGVITDYFINITKVTFETENHKKVTGYKINTEPLLYTYQLAKDHILNAPLELLDVSDKISNSEYVTEFKLYLLQQIILLKNGYRDNNAFRLDTIYEKTGIPTPLEEIENKTFKNANTRKKELSERRKKDRTKIEGILESWKEKSFIKDFKRDKDSYIVEVEKQEAIDVESKEINH